MIPFPPFEPDRTIYAPNASRLITNCIPVADGWGPLPQFVPLSEALASEPKGAIYVRTTAGNYKIFVGTTTKLYLLDTTDYSWTDVTRSSGGDYSLPEGDNWSFAVFGSNLIAVQQGDVPQYIDIDSGTNFAALSGSPPQAKYVGTAGDFVILANLSGDPLGLRTSALGDAGAWTVGERLAQDQSMPDGEDIQGLFSGETGCLIFQRKKIRQLSVQPDANFPIRIDVVNASRGAISPLSIAGIAPELVGYLSADGFCLGVEGRPIGLERVDRWFNDTIDSNTLLDVQGVADPFQRIIWWRGVAPDATRFLVGYHWGLDRWCYSDQNTYSLAALTTPGVTWDSAEDFFANWDDADVPWDSRILTGGIPTFGGFNSDFKFGLFSGGNMAAQLDTGAIPLSMGRRSFLRSARLFWEGTGAHTLTVGTNAKHGEAISFGSAVSPFSETGICHFRSTGLHHQFRLDIAAGEDWSHIMGIEPEFRPEGKR